MSPAHAEERMDVNIPVSLRVHKAAKQSSAQVRQQSRTQAHSQGAGGSAAQHGAG